MVITKVSLHQPAHPVGCWSKVLPALQWDYYFGARFYCPHVLSDSN